MVMTLDQLFAEKQKLSAAQMSNLSPGYGMNFELLRLGSFKSWPRWAPIQPNRLARGGFYYTGSHDEVVCFACGGKVKQWHYGDRPIDRHRRVNGQCPFLGGSETTNIPLPRPEAEDLVEGRTDADHFEENTLETSSSARLGYPQRYHTAPGDFSASNIRPLSMLSPEYQNEAARLQTFRNWPDHAYVGPEELAQAGFVYLGSGDRVQCAFCKGVLRNWAPGDRAFMEHQKHFPQCSFVKNPTAAAGPPPRVSGANAGTSSLNTAATAGSAMSQSSLNELGIETDLPKHHQYALEENRLATFSSWPKHLSQKPAELAMCGFFFVGQADSVKCFWCDGGLRNWEPGDDPWVEHARWFPKCGHLKRTKGPAFIEQVKKDHNASSSQSGAASGAGTNVAAPTSTIFRDIDQREVTARMDTEVVSKVLSMGFERDFVRNVIEYRLRTQGDDFSSAEVLLETVLNFSDNPPSNFPAPPSGTSPGAGPTDTPASVTAPAAVTAPASGEEQTSTGSSIKGKKKNKNKKKKGSNGQGSAENVGSNEESNSNGSENMEVEDPKPKETEAKQQAPECKVCMDAEVNVVFLPCGHLVCCGRCAPAMRNCPICRALIRGTVNVYMS